MKVLLLTAHYSPNIGGVETHLDDLTKSLIIRKHIVQVLTYRPLTAKVKWKLSEKAKSLKILRIPWITGLFYKLVPYPVLAFLYLLPGLFAVLPFVLASNRADVIHAHGLVAGFVGVFWGKLFRTRVVVSTHSLYEFPKSGFYHQFVKWIFNNADHVSTLSNQALREIRSIGISKENSSRFTYWVDLNMFKPVKGVKSKVGWKDKFVVLFVGRLVEEKGVLVLLESFKFWNKEIHLAIAGDGPLRVEIEKLEKSSDNLHYLGSVDQEDLAKYYPATDLSIIPSTSEEGFGRVIIESLACGTPVIGSNRGAIPEAMDSSVGELILITPNKIKDVVQDYYENLDKLTLQSKNAKNFARERYSEKNIYEIIKTYKY